MQVTIISGSHRSKSESRRIANTLSDVLSKELNAISTILDLAELDLPFWDEGVWEQNEQWQKLWGPVRQTLEQSDGFVVISPEWSGMATPVIKNFFLLCDSHELAHKPGLIVGISSGMGGTYPVAELRMSSYKNTRICWIPENLIIRDVKNIWNGDKANSNLDKSVKKRAIYSLKILTAYCNALKAVRESGMIDHEQFPYGI